MADAESALIQELRALGGVTKGDTFEVRHGGARIRVEYTSGSSSRLVLTAPYDEFARTADAAHAGGYRSMSALAAIRPMRIELRLEGPTQRQAKASGIDVEFQSGDPVFDDAVYVDTATPPEVLARVLEADARRAALDLFALEFTSVTIDDRDGNVVASLFSFSSLKPREKVGERAVDAFARLACALPLVAKLEGAHPKHPLSGVNLALGLAAAVTVLGSLPFYFTVTAGDRCPDDMSGSQAATCFGPALVGVAVALVVAVLTSVLASRFTLRYRGRSDSSSYGAMFSLFAATIAFSMTATLVALVVARSR